MRAVKGKFFFGGIHPRDMKYISAEAAIEAMPPPAVAAVSTLQSIGRPAIPVVEAGRKVKEGELLARADGEVSSNVFSSIAGAVREIKRLPAANGSTEEFIIIEGDGSEEKFRFPSLSKPSAEEIRERIKEAGIVGLGGAGFPAAVKATPKGPVDTLILNGAECEPYLTCDYRLMLEESEAIAAGARYIARAVGAQRILIGIESNKPDCIRLFEEFDDIQPVILKRKYPMGGEKQLIYAATGRRVGPGKLPSDVAVAVQNVATAFAVYEAVEKGKPLYERVITVSGQGVRNAKNLLVRLGTPIKDIIDYCGGETLPPRKLVLGGPMTGTALASYEQYTHKTTSGILLMNRDEAAAEQPTPCLNCGKCADVCPMHLMPMNTAFYSAAGDLETAARLGQTAACIECGACEYICPAKRPLIQAIRKTKAYLREKSKEGKKNG